MKKKKIIKVVWAVLSLMIITMMILWTVGSAFM